MNNRYGHFVYGGREIIAETGRRIRSGGDICIGFLFYWFIKSVYVAIRRVEWQVILIYMF